MTLIGFQFKIIEELKPHPINPVKYAAINPDK